MTDAPNDAVLALPVLPGHVASDRAVTDRLIERAILDLTAGRGPGASICPSEAARAVAQTEAMPDWRPLMTRVRQVAATLAHAGRIDIMRKGKPIDPAALHGVIRLRSRP